MNFKVFFLTIFVSISMVNFNLANAAESKNITWFYDENILPDFTKENSWDKNSVYFMYLFDEYLEKKSEELSSSTWSENKAQIETIDELININKSNIDLTLKSFDNDLEVIKQISEKLTTIDKIDFDSNKPVRYKTFIELINKTWYVNSQNWEWKNLFFHVLSYWDYELVDFVLNRWVNQNIINKDWNNAAMIFMNTWIHYSQDIEDKTKAWTLDIETTKKYINLLIKRGLDINNINQKWENILFNAIRLWDKDLIELIINSWVDINIKNNEWLSAFMIAINKKASNDILSLFIENPHFDSTIVDINWNGYIHNLIADDSKILKKLLDVSNDLNLINSYWETPLIKLVKDTNNEEDIILKLNLFLDKWNINLNIQDNLWKSLFLYSIEKKFNKLFNLLIDKWINPLQKDIEWNTALISATKNNDLEIINTLIEMWDYNLNSQNNLWETALHIAFSKWYFWIINLLLEKWIDLDSFNKERENILIQSIEKSDIKVLNDISKYNPDYEVELENWTTPIFLAVKRENIEVIKKLIEAWVDINHLDESWKNIIYNSLNSGNYNVIKLLINSWVDLSNIKLKINDEEWDIIDLINSSENKIVDLINDEEEKEIPLIIISCIKNDYNTVNLLIDNNLNINDTDSVWNNCLNYSVWYNSIAISKILIDNWIDLDNKDLDTEKTPIIIASEKWFTDSVKLLIEKWADLDIWDTNWINPLIAATLNWHTKIWKILIEAWADINQKDEWWLTPLYYSVKWWNIELTKQILKKWVNQIDILNELWDSTLIMSVTNNYIEISKILIDAWADISIKNTEWFDAIYYATVNNNSEIFKLILEKNPNLIYNTYDWITIEEIAKEWNNLDILHILKVFENNK